MPYIFTRILDEENLTEAQQKRNEFIKNFIIGKINESRMENFKKTNKSFYTTNDLLKVARASYQKVNESYQEGKFDDAKEISRLGKVISTYIQELKSKAVNPSDVENELYSKEGKKTENEMYEILKQWNKEIDNFTKKKKEETIKIILDFTKTKEEKEKALEDYKIQCLGKIDEYINKISSEEFKKQFSPETIEKMFDVNKKKNGVVISSLSSKKNSILNEYEQLKKKYIKEEKKSPDLNDFIQRFKDVATGTLSKLSNNFENKLGELEGESFKKEYKKLLNESEFKKLQEDWYKEVIDKINEFVKTKNTDGSTDTDLQSALTALNKNEKERDNFIRDIKNLVKDKLIDLRKEWKPTYEEEISKEPNAIKSKGSGEPITSDERVFDYKGKQMPKGVYGENDSAIIKYIKKNYSFDRMDMKVKDLYSNDEPNIEFITTRKSKPKLNEIKVYKTIDKLNNKIYYIDASLVNNKSDLKYKLLSKDKNFKIYNNVKEYDDEKNKRRG